MVESSAGQKLAETRHARGLTVDEAAHATKMRPDKILALENDDYSRFGSPAYAKGFLLIYSRFLGIDVSPSLRQMEAPRLEVNPENYQYLNNAPVPPPVTRVSTRPRERRPPSIVPLLIFLSVGAVACFIVWAVVGAQRLELNKPVSTPAAPSVEGVGEDRPETQTAPKRSPARDIPLRAVSAPTSTAESPDALTELVVEPLRKTMVTIRRDSPTSKPIFEDVLYPHAPPLKLRGARFFVEVKDQSAVQIRQNGHPIAYQSPGISIP